MLTTPDGSVIRPRLQRSQPARTPSTPTCAARADGQLVWTPFVTDIDYNAKGQRELIEYGNGVSTAYDYDPLTFRLIRLQNAQAQRSALQDLSYTYDPAGNITHIRDDAQQTIYFRNAGRAERRLHLRRHLPADRGDRPRAPRPDRRPTEPPTAPDAFNRFTPVSTIPATARRWGATRSSYVYDAVGNFLDMQHRGSDPAKLDARLRVRRSQPARTRTRSAIG